MTRPRLDTLLGSLSGDLVLAMVERPVAHVPRAKNRAAGNTAAFRTSHAATWALATGSLGCVATSSTALALRNGHPRGDGARWYPQVLEYLRGRTMASKATTAREIYEHQLREALAKRSPSLGDRHYPRATYRELRDLCALWFSAWREGVSPLGSDSLPDSLNDAAFAVRDVRKQHSRPDGALLSPDWIATDTHTIETWKAIATLARELDASSTREIIYDKPVSETISDALTLPFRAVGRGLGSLVDASGLKTVAILVGGGIVVAMILPPLLRRT